MGTIPDVEAYEGWGQGAQAYKCFVMNASRYVKLAECGWPAAYQKVLTPVMC